MGRHRGADRGGQLGADGHGHAIVIGGSVAGLLAARVLADHFRRVTVVERDRLPTEPGFRKGVPQSRHLHVLLGRGLELFEGLFPGFEAEMGAAGAPMVPWGEVLWLNAAGWARRDPASPIRLLGASRELLEARLRSRVASLAGVRLLDGWEVVGLLARPGEAGVGGVGVRPRPGHPEPGNQLEEVSAELVVDASGRGSRAAQWLADLGYAPPRQTHIDAFLGYATGHFRIPPGSQRNWRMLILQPKPPDTRGGVIFPIEGDRWIVTLGGIGRDYPPTDPAGFLAFAASLPSRLLYESIRDAEPLSPMFAYRHTSNQWRHFEALQPAPERFAVIGDAACAFNPVYGQGMTAAAMVATALGTSLARQHRQRPDGDLSGFARRFQQQVARCNSGAWLLATREDLRYPTTQGPRPGRLTRLTYRYADQVLQAANRDLAVQVAFLNVVHLRHRPSALFQPRILRSVLTSR